jgi:hypothetical protein
MTTQKRRKGAARAVPSTELLTNRLANLRERVRETEILLAAAKELDRQQLQKDEDSEENGGENE